MPSETQERETTTRSEWISRSPTNSGRCGPGAQILGDRTTLGAAERGRGSDERYDRELWAELAKAGLLGRALPEAPAAAAAASSRSACSSSSRRTVAPLPLLATLVLGALPLARFGTDEQQAASCPASSPATVLTAALTDGATARVAHDRCGECTATRWRLDGMKIGVPVAHLAAAVLVPRRHRRRSRRCSSSTRRQPGSPSRARNDQLRAAVRDEAATA